MKLLFADTFYWVALLNPQDEDYTTVKLFSRSLASTKLITTEEVLAEAILKTVCDLTAGVGRD